MLDNPKVRGWLYVIGAVVAMLMAVAIFFLVVFGYVTGTQIQAGVAAVAFFVIGLLQILARMNTPTG